MCLFPEENQQPVLGGNRFPLRKVTIFIGRETKIHINITIQQLRSHFGSRLVNIPLGILAGLGSPLSYLVQAR